MKQELCGRCKKVDVDEEDNIHRKYGRICVDCYYQIPD